MIIGRVSNINDIEDKFNNGLDMLELELSEDNMNLRLDGYEDKIYSISNRLNSYRKTILLEDDDKKANEYMEIIFKKADAIGKKSDRRVGVIVENDIGVEKLKNIGVLKKIYDKIERLLSIYDNTELLIENSNFKCGMSIYSNALLSSEYISVIEELRKIEVCKDRVYGLLNIMNAMASSKMLEMLYGKVDWLYYEDYFKDYASLVKYIRFGNIINKGLYNNEYDVGFRDGNSDDEKFFKFTLDMIKRYIPNSNICIGVSGCSISNIEKILKNLKEQN